MEPAEGLTHVDEQGRVQMVDVSAKRPTVRQATARGRVRMKRGTLRAVLAGEVRKGNVLTTAQLAGIMAAKRTHELIPLCHPLPLTSVDVRLEPGEDGQSIEIEATVRTTAQTGVEMEALTAVSVAGLTVYDMCKALERGMRIEDVRLARKSGGRSGTIELE